MARVDEFCDGPLIFTKRPVVMRISYGSNGHKGCAQFLKTSHSTGSCWL